MNKWVKTGIALSALAVLGIGLGLLRARVLAKPQSQSERMSNTRSENFLARINKEAIAAKSNGQRETNALAKDVVNSFAPKAVPAFAKWSMSERLTRAEMYYRSTGRGGITEARVVKAVNDLTNRLGAPAYARTNYEQVRFLRVRMMPNLPNFVGQEIKKSSINPVMSPLEGAAVALTMLQQKMNNCLYQVKAADFKNKVTQEWKTHLPLRVQSASSGGTAKPTLTAQPHSDKQKEMREVVTKGAAALGKDELMNLLDTSLDTLGVLR
jgi:hypothetical protein